MIDESTEEAAALYVFDLLEGDEARAFAERLRSDPALRQYVDALEATVAQLAHEAAPRPLPPGLERKILQAIHAPVEAPAAARAWVSWLGWAAAACLAAACFWLNRERALAEGGRLQAQQELAGWRQRDALSRMQIATLSSKLAQVKNATAVVVWDEEQQRGVLKLSQMPAPAEGHDYQLWVIDPQYKQPVSAGVFEVGKPELTRISFQAARPIGAAEKFAVSLEAKGGAPEARGPILMISE